MIFLFSWVILRFHVTVNVRDISGEILRCEKRPISDIAIHSIASHEKHHEKRSEI